MPTLPDAFTFGPFVLPAPWLFLFLGAAVVYGWSSRRAARFGLAPEWAEGAVLWILLGAWAGAKSLDVLRSPDSVWSSPRLLISLPVGPVAAAGAVAGALAGFGWRLRGQWQHAPRWLDAVSVPVLVGLSVASLGVRDTRSLPLALAFLLAAVLLHALEGRAEFEGHRFLAAVVLGALAVGVGDLFRPLAGGYRGISSTQLTAAAAAAGAYFLASWRVRGKGPRERQAGGPSAARGDGAE